MYKLYTHTCTHMCACAHVHTHRCRGADVVVRGYFPRSTSLLSPYRGQEMKLISGWAAGTLLTEPSRQLLIPFQRKQGWELWESSQISATQVTNSLTLDPFSEFRDLGFLSQECHMALYIWVKFQNRVFFVCLFFLFHNLSLKMTFSISEDGLRNLVYLRSHHDRRTKQYIV